MSIMMRHDEVYINLLITATHLKDSPLFERQLGLAIPLSLSADIGLCPPYPGILTL